MSEFLLNSNKRHFVEHYNFPDGEDITNIQGNIEDIGFLGSKELKCIEIQNHSDLTRTLHTSYFVGTDWISEDKAIYVEPKLNNATYQTNYLLMLFSILKRPEMAKHIGNLYEVKWNKKEISIEQNQDLLTPLLVVEFLKIIQVIVRKGLKKSYYKVQNNLNSRVKGKILVSKTIKENLARNKATSTICEFEEFGFNGLENKLLKKALIFVRRYLAGIPNLGSSEFINQTMNYILPAFESVEEDINVNDIRNFKANIFYKEYDEAIRIAKLILKKFGYNIFNTVQQSVKTPPFWINMATLFELYTLGLLMDRFSSNVKYHFATYGNELDFLLNTSEYKLVVDAKYKPKHKTEPYHEDIRQVSGYARLKKVQNELQKKENELIDCLIIYPDQDSDINLADVDLTDKKFANTTYNGLYKIGIKLPTLNKPTGNLIA